jgi:S1-C subfamily serine protease
MSKRFACVSLPLSLCAFAFSLSAWAQSPDEPAPPQIPNTALPSASVPPPPPAPVVLASAPVAASRACADNWIRDVYPRVRSAVVKIDVPNGVGTGFVFGNRRWVATAFHVIEFGEDVRVTFAGDPDEVEARVVAVDKQNDLALLELARESRVEPLQPSTQAPEPGTNVAAVGNPLLGMMRSESGMTDFKGLLGWSVTRGIISAANDKYVQTDAPVSPGNSGGPLVDCDGRVLAVSSMIATEGANIAFFVRVSHLNNLVPRVGHQPEYTGHVRGWGSLVFAFQWQPDYAKHYGFAVGTGAFLGNHFGLRAVGGLLWGHVDSSLPATIDQSSFRWMLGLDARYLIRPFTKGDFNFALGGGAAWVSTASSTRRAVLTPGPNIDIVEDSTKTGRLMPFVEVGFMAHEGPGIGFTAMLDTVETSRWIAQFTVGAGF